MREQARHIIAVGGFSSETGKTTLLCELLRALPGWEAIKLTRGHYRSCGKDPHACCVGHLLSDEPVIRSGRQQTYAAGKDTGRYWDAGASNVHWVIVTDQQVERGIEQAIERVASPGVLIEGNSFLKFIEADFTIICAKPEGGKIKPTARRALAGADAIYLFDDGDIASAPARFASWRNLPGHDNLIGYLPVYTHEELQPLIARAQAASMDGQGSIDGAAALDMNRQIA